MSFVRVSHGYVTHKHVAGRRVYKRHGQPRIIGEVRSRAKIAGGVKEVVVEAVLHDGRHRVLLRAVEQIETVNWLAEVGVGSALLLEFVGVDQRQALVWGWIHFPEV